MNITGVLTIESYKKGIPYEAHINLKDIDVIRVGVFTNDRTTIVTYDGFEFYIRQPFNVVCRKIQRLL